MQFLIGFIFPLHFLPVFTPAVKPSVMSKWLAVNITWNIYLYGVVFELYISYILHLRHLKLIPSQARNSAFYCFFATSNNLKHVNYGTQSDTG